MLGFDLSSPDKLINNIYKGSKYYYPEDMKGFNPKNWLNQLRLASHSSGPLLVVPV